LFAQIDPALLQSRAALRAATPDRVPLAGLAPDAFAATQRQTANAVHDGLYLLGGFGSRGFSLGPLLGERIVCEMLGEPQALDAGALEAVHPARFLERALRRGPLNLA
jgi:tRNA 5-methylaminomethyl-2-thiouridine biosynthesis bifunctional protein